MKKIVSLLLATAVILTSNTLSVHAETKQENLPDSEVVEEFNVFNTDVIETTEEIPDIQDVYKRQPIGHTAIFN